MKSSSIIFFFFLISTGAFANTYKSTVEYLNPNGCRVFDMIVRPECPNEYAPQLCKDSKTALAKVASENPGLISAANCSRVHTGDLAKRILEEAAMHSTSFDGYAINIKLTGYKSATYSLFSDLENPALCALAEADIKTFETKGVRIQIQCHGSKLVGQLQF